MIQYPTYTLEAELKEFGYEDIIGIDEVGRGSGISSVVSAAVIIPQESVGLLAGKVRDSKQLSLKKREELYTVIIDNCLCAFEGIDNQTIDKINILQATKLSMTAALESLFSKYKTNKEYVLVDGPITINSLNRPQRGLIDGDAICLSISAASIIAKVVRDNIITALDMIFPMYNWKKNMGYLTKEHIAAIKEYGVTPFHRLSFNKVGR